MNKINFSPNFTNTVQDQFRYWFLRSFRDCLVQIKFSDLLKLCKSLSWHTLVRCDSLARIVRCHLICLTNSFVILCKFQSNQTLIRVNKFEELHSLYFLCFQTSVITTLTSATLQRSFLCLNKGAFSGSKGHFSASRKALPGFEKSVAQTFSKGFGPVILLYIVYQSPRNPDAPLLLMIFSTPRYDGLCLVYD